MVEEQQSQINPNHHVLKAEGDFEIDPGGSVG